MTIESYAYGVMKVDGKVYDKDLIVFPESINTEWWRREDHSLSIEDLDSVVKFEPEVLIVGKGTEKKMLIPLLTKLALQEKISN
ncbi:MAG: Mth938-like domain-containing protein [Candidatus Omnitrophica bacterium]|nr:Mth938-like domain-containing protein [Candidatus Omnitrophota bacterium]